ncbi:hypothetical protein DRQ00_09515 [candidate division KSB1 bacterium]|nr:MAG: hypothetical protein DRQ00_09515 [candidate division KSB1 bacterium]RKY88545.1 MAG: hypothetical protein DRQ11_03400 [candidate division KSB1 bacterium]
MKPGACVNNLSKKRNITFVYDIFRLTTFYFKPHSAPLLRGEGVRPEGGQFPVSSQEEGLGDEVQSF